MHLARHVKRDVRYQKYETTSGDNIKIELKEMGHVCVE